VLTWSQRYRLRGAVTRRLWPIPLVFGVLAVVLAQIVSWIDRTYTPGSSVTFDSGSAQATFAAIASGMLVFIGFVFSVVTFAIQYEASTYTPRLLRAIADSAAMRLTLGVFIATFVYALLSLAQIEPDREYRYSVLVAVVLVGVSLLFFLALMTEVADRARSGRTVGDVAREGRRVIGRTCRRQLDPEAAVVDTPRLDGGGRVVLGSGEAGGVIQAIHVDGLVEIAVRHDVVIELVPEVGGFVASDAPLFRVHGDAPGFPDHDLIGAIAIGEERTSEQDPRLSIRILVDIAIRALSPAINDPTTAVEAVERIGDLLLLLSTRALPDGIHRDRSGTVRLVEPVPTWDDYIALAFTEIRLYGAGSPFVAREMHLLLASLRRCAPAPRQSAIERQVGLLEHAVRESGAEPPTADVAAVDASTRQDGAAGGDSARS
jgi:uncharacterized membrane protein